MQKADLTMCVPASSVWPLFAETAKVLLQTTPQHLRAALDRCRREVGMCGVVVSWCGAIVPLTSHVCVYTRSRQWMVCSSARTSTFGHRHQATQWAASL